MPSRPAAAALALAALARAAAAADPTDFRSLGAHVRSELAAERPWAALPFAARRAALPGLPAAQRAEALRDEAEVRGLAGDVPGAEAAALRALKLRPDDPETAALLARLLRDRPERALRYAEAAARRGPPRRRAAALALSAEIRLDLGEPAAARADARRALELAPDDLDAMRLLAWTARGRPRQAAPWARRACAEAGRAPEWRRGAALRLCAEIWSELGRPQEAEEALREALRSDPDDFDALHALLKLRRSARGPSPPVDAREDPTPPLPPAGEPDELEALRELFVRRRAEGDRESAVAAAESFSAASRRAPSWLRAAAQRLNAGMWAELGDAEKVFASRRRLEESDSQYLTLATFPFVPGNRGLNEDTLSKSFEALAQVQLDVGEEARAEATARRGLAELPENARLGAWLVGLRLRQGRLADARELARSVVASAEKRVKKAAAAPPSARHESRASVDARAAADEALRVARGALEEVRRAEAR